uniref:SLC26A/SulP transporter domain-containing protein n=1 Tax=Panagrolaimus superbus TaxID=310955 RepID=A0A914YD93_9BILA
MNQIEFNKVYGRLPPGYGKISTIQKIRKNLTPKWFKNKIYGTIPILEWLPKYDFKKCFFRDLIGGLTVGIMHVPQGMAYATLAGVEPIYGLYSSFFASLIYMFFGTSRHISIGTFAVASMMVGSVRFRLIPESIDSVNVHSAADGILGSNVTTAINHPLINNNYEVMTLLSTLTFGVGIVQ